MLKELNYALEKTARTGLVFRFSSRPVELAITSEKWEHFFVLTVEISNRQHW